VAVTAAAGLPTVAAKEMTTVGKSSLDRQDFMTLFITQLQYQDPTKPLDSTEMASQLAQFSSMEATMKMGDNVEKLLNYQVSQNNLQLLNLLDKDVQAMGNNLGVTDGKAGKGEFILVEPIKKAVLYVYDVNGALVRSMDLDSLKVGTFEVNWDGKNNGGQEVEDGLYSYEVKPLDDGGADSNIEYRMSGKVTGVKFDSDTGKAMLTMDNQVSVLAAEVLQVM
jgi:flagellar basal-body rod modification protein FlgD